MATRGANWYLTRIGSDTIVSNMTYPAMPSITSTLRLAGRLTTLLSTTDTPEAADLARTVSTNPLDVGLDTLERVSGLLSMSPAEFFKETNA